VLTEQIRVLLVDDDNIDRESMLRFVRDCQLPYAMHAASSKKEAEALLAVMNFDVVLLDFELGDGSGLELLGKMGDAASIIITGCGSEEVAVEAMRLGACDYLIKDTDRSYLTVLPLTIENVLARRKAERDREELIVQLQQALSQVKTLRGILPICGRCKKIRNDGGFWSEVEHFVKEHSEAEFSHGFCPDCLRRELDSINLE
jgi:DNA-binding NtrC family response regulator